MQILKQMSFISIIRQYSCMPKLTLFWYFRSMLQFAQSQLATSPSRSSTFKPNESFLTTPIQEMKRAVGGNEHVVGNGQTHASNYPHHNYYNIGPVLGDVASSNRDHMPPSSSGMSLTADEGPYLQVVNTFIIRI